VTGAGALKVVNYGGQALRGSLFLCGAALMIASLHLLPLSLVTVVLFSSPLFVGLISAPLLGERVQAYQWIAIAVGFVGVLMIVQPGTRGAEWIVALPVLTALSNAVRDVITRRLSRTESSMSMLFWSGVIVSVGGAFTIAFGWKAIELESGLWFLAAGLSNALAHFMVIEAFRLGNAAIVAPFRYSALLWALLIGFLVWREVPDAWMLAGAAVVVCAGLYMLRQSTRPA
jgi:drug/metabolite transporter (DMT)-like permease